MRLAAVCVCVCSQLGMRANMCFVCRARSVVSSPLNSDIQHANPRCSAVLHYITFDPCQREPLKSAIFHRGCQQEVVSAAPVQLMMKYTRSLHDQ